MNEMSLPERQVIIAALQALLGKREFVVIVVEERDGGAHVVSSEMDRNHLKAIVTATALGLIEGDILPKPFGQKQTGFENN